jgi:hypothetical protein
LRVEVYADGTPATTVVETRIATEYCFSNADQLYGARPYTLIAIGKLFEDFFCV